MVTIWQIRPYDMPQLWVPYALKQWVLPGPKSKRITIRGNLIFKNPDNILLKE